MKNRPATRTGNRPATRTGNRPATRTGNRPATPEGPCATVGEARYNSRFVVTSLQKPNAQTVYEAMYCDRGAAENWIKEQKNDRFLDRCSSGLWNVNALRRRLEHLPVSAMLAPEPPIDAARVPVPDPGARDGVHAADPSGVRVRLPVLEGFPVDLGQPGTNVKARCNRVHDAGGGARRPPRARDAQRFAVPPAKRRGKHTRTRPPKPFRTRDAKFHARTHRIP